MSISIPGPHTQLVIMRIKQCKNINLLKRELHEAAIAAAEAPSVKWDGQPLDV